MMNGINPKKNFSSTAIILSVFFLTLICVYALFFIYPSYRSFSHTRKAIVDQTTKLEHLKVLYPVFARSKALDQIQFKHALPFPGRVQIHRTELAKLSRKISNTAKRNHMTMSGSDFDINSLNNQSQSVSMVIELKGKLFDFRQFLIEIIGFEFFDSIGNLTINADKDQMKNFSLNLNIMIKKNPS
jgi:hypothetical protein